MLETINPFPCQRAGKRFLANLPRALLADDPRVGKTGAAIMACDEVEARTVLVITTVSNQFNMARDFADWQDAPRTIAVADEYAGEDVWVVPWSRVAWPHYFDIVTAREWDVIILDEAHYASNMSDGYSEDAVQRTFAVYGRGGIYLKGKRVWLLDGTPIVTAPQSLYPALRALWPERLPRECLTYRGFIDRFCDYKTNFLHNQRSITFRGGKNEVEFRDILAPIMLRRTQADVGIRPPTYDLLYVDALDPFEGQEALAQAIIDAIDNGGDVDGFYATIRKTTGLLKAVPVAKAAIEATENDNLVVMCWHHEVMDLIENIVSAKRPVIRLDGSTSPANRAKAQKRFSGAQNTVFLAQMQSAGEAIDLSTACELWFAEISAVPKDMHQASLRITNHNQKRNCVVRVCAVRNSQDEAIMRSLTRRVASIRAITEKR